MPNQIKQAFLAELTSRYGNATKLQTSESLFDVGGGDARIYIRYSKRHPRNRTFFGLRKIDLQSLEGHNSVICFLWDGQRAPLFVLFQDFEELLAGLPVASDGQIKAQVYEQTAGTELYLSNAGRFNVESYMGWGFLDRIIKPAGTSIPVFAHNQIQTLLGGIGVAKGFDIWIPTNDRCNLDWSLTEKFRPTLSLPPTLDPVREIAEQVDVIWIEPGARIPAAMYEVEHSTSIYSGLLRFNDVRLTLRTNEIRYGIVSNDERRSRFASQLRRPTFQASGLCDNCSFFEYQNVFGWYRRLLAGERAQ